MSAQENQQNSAVSGGAEGNQERSQALVMPCNPQAFAQFFTAFEAFYRQCKPAGQVAVAQVVLTQDCIPDTPPSDLDRPSTSAANAAALRASNDSTDRPNTRSQSSSSGKSKGGQKGGKKGKASTQGSNTTNPQKDVGLPSVFQNPPPQAAPAEGASGSSSDEVAQGQQDVQVHKHHWMANQGRGKKRGSIHQRKARRVSGLNRRMNQVPLHLTQRAILLWRSTGATGRIVQVFLCGCMKGGLIHTASPLMVPWNGRMVH
ncbi:Hypothetical predicted protein [Podarcis lilfordi]|uniref:Uncharacterized protein n=1 Tax=Podarcis lilfordi TaxID=74358 RepID=A0AA35LPF4_9SAUR|nr:Hypothetical predicted protein [Podarcis lilfordi]